mmetsp:Transcript_93396/g.166130  ORF Transcript_93396/g.166130 Transcript_93396/m.166130 type:complete len:290 (-) Transcript_93396:1449-2318(-)
MRKDTIDGFGSWGHRCVVRHIRTAHGHHDIVSGLHVDPTISEILRERHRLAIEEHYISYVGAVEADSCGTICISTKKGQHRWTFGIALDHESLALERRVTPSREFARSRLADCGKSISSDLEITRCRVSQLVATQVCPIAAVGIVCPARGLCWDHLHLHSLAVAALVSVHNLQVQLQACTNLLVEVFSCRLQLLQGEHPVPSYHLCHCPFRCLFPCLAMVDHEILLRLHVHTALRILNGLSVHPDFPDVVAGGTNGHPVVLLCNTSWLRHARTGYASLAQAVTMQPIGL